MRVLLLLPLVISLLLSCSEGGTPNHVPTSSGDGADPSIEPPTAEELASAIDSAAAYLTDASGKTGQFVYLVDLDLDKRPAPAYNTLRHAGTIYAMTEYQKRSPHAETAAAILRATGFLRRETMAPIPLRSDLLAVWSHPEITRGSSPVQAKLGGAGLALVALTQVETLFKGTVPLDDLRRLARFILYMQKDDGSFYSKYIPKEGGRNDEWTSLYYPGEAALGLVLLYELDPDSVWLQGAADAIGYLARKRAGKRNVEADHWALLATARLLPVYDECTPPIPREGVIRHAIQIVKEILESREEYPADSPRQGGLRRDGTTTPTSTRLEGLQAALPYLPDSEEDLRARIEQVCQDGIAFLLRSQVKEGRYAGAIPHAIAPLPPDHPDFTREFNNQVREVRIDYVQHALSAMIAYEIRMTETRAPAQATP